MAASGHLESWCSDLPKYKNGAINRLPMPHLVGKVVLHRFLCPFIFKFHFQYGRWRPFWILASPKFRSHFREGHGSSFFSKYPKELKSSVKPNYALGGHGTPRYHPTILGWSRLSNPSDLPCLFSCKMIKQNQLENHLVLLCHFCEAPVLLVKHTVTWISWNWHIYCCWFHCEDTESMK